MFQIDLSKHNEMSLIREKTCQELPGYTLIHVHVLSFITSSQESMNNSCNFNKDWESMSVLCKKLLKGNMDVLPR